MEELRRIREEIGWSQYEVGRRSGVNAATINQIEMGRRSPRLDTLEKLAITLGVEVGDFFPKVQPQLPLLDSIGSWGLQDLSPKELGELIIEAEKQALANFEREYEDQQNGFRTSSDSWIDLLNDFSDLVTEIGSDLKISPEAGQLLQCLDFSIFSTYVTEEESVRAMCKSERVADLNEAENRLAQASRLIDDIRERKARELTAEQESEFMARLHDRLENKNNEAAKKGSKWLKAE